MSAHNLVLVANEASTPLAQKWPICLASNFRDDPQAVLRWRTLSRFPRQHIRKGSGDYRGHPQRLIPPGSARSHSGWPLLECHVDQRGHPFPGIFHHGTGQTGQQGNSQRNYQNQTDFPGPTQFRGLYRPAFRGSAPRPCRGNQDQDIWSDRLVVEKVQSLGLEDFVLVSPDYGFSKRVARLASLLSCAHTAADKDRYDTGKTIVGQVSSVVKDRTAIVCDDMIRTGGSIIQTANRCLDAGAREVYVLATHLVLSGNARQKFEQSRIVRILGSDSYPGVEPDDLVDVYSVAPLIKKALTSHLISPPDQTRDRSGSDPNPR